MTAVGRPRAPLAAAAVLGLAAALSGCGSASAPSPPTGVDQLTIPTPSLDRADYVTAVDNRWLALTPGAEWEYRATIDGETRTFETTVMPPSGEVAGMDTTVAGVDATVVYETVRDETGNVVEDNYTWYAQDTDGNVWCLGEEYTRYRPHTVGGFSWRAGEDGAQAGLAMPAEPRVGDGFHSAYSPRDREVVTRVVGLDAAATVPTGTFTGLVEVEVSSPLEPDVVVRRLYAPGVGMVLEEDVEGPERLVALVEHTEG